jgi:predicted nucleic acid-binding protein
MNIFLDANILVSVVNKEYPLFSHTSRILSLADSSRFKLFTSPVCLAIAFYFAEKKHKASAKKKIGILADHLHIAECSKSCIQKAIANAAVKDFEDGLEYYAALESKCSCIITEDKDDFYFSDIEVLDSISFYNKYMGEKTRRS